MTTIICKAPIDKIAGISSAEILPILLATALLGYCLYMLFKAATTHGRRTEHFVRALLAALVCMAMFSVASSESVCASTMGEYLLRGHVQLVGEQPITVNVSIEDTGINLQTESGRDRIHSTQARGNLILRGSNSLEATYDDPQIDINCEEDIEVQTRAVTYTQSTLQYGIHARISSQEPFSCELQIRDGQDIQLRGQVRVSP